MPHGADVFRAYINPDLAAAGREYDEFIAKVARSGNRAKI
jgi:hypothetical protein